MARQPTQHNPQPDSDSFRSTGRSAGQPPRRLPDRLSVRRLFLALLEQMVRHRPLAFWSAVWMVPLLMAIVAVTALMTPEYAAQKLPSPPPPPLLPAPTATQPPVQSVSTTSTAIVPVDRLQSVKHRPDRSLWSLGAIVLTCATSSVLVARWLNRAQTHPRLTAKETPRTAKHSQPAPSATVRGSEAMVSSPNRTTLTAMPAVSSPQRAAASTHQATHQAFMSPAPAHQAFTQQQAVPRVTIVPSSESHPLDWSEDSLADTMDIRKRRSLSSWL